MVIIVEFAGVRKLGLSKLKQDKIKGLGALKKSLRLKNLFGRFFHQHFEMLIKPLNVFFFFVFFFHSRLLPGTRAPAVGPAPCGVQVPSF